MLSSRQDGCHTGKMINRQPTRSPVLEWPFPPWNGPPLICSSWIREVGEMMTSHSNHTPIQRLIKQYRIYTVLVVVYTKVLLPPIYKKCRPFSTKFVQNERHFLCIGESSSHVTMSMVTVPFATHQPSCSYLAAYNALSLFSFLSIGKGARKGKLPSDRSLLCTARWATMHVEQYYSTSRSSGTWGGDVNGWIMHAGQEDTFMVHGAS